MKMPAGKFLGFLLLCSPPMFFLTNLFPPVIPDPPLISPSPLANHPLGLRVEGPSLNYSERGFNQFFGGIASV